MATETFYSDDTWTVPSGVQEVTFTAAGGDGGDYNGNFSNESAGGDGHEVTGTISVNPGDTFYINVGSDGSDTSDNSGTCGGGSASDVRGPNSDDLSDQLFVGAGGGGGSATVSANAEHTAGGDGGLPDGGGGATDGSDITGGGATQSTGGSGGYQAFSDFAYDHQGGNGGRWSAGGGAGNEEVSGSGGQGYYGGGGGAESDGDVGGGGGGSSYITSSATNTTSGTAWGGALVQVEYTVQPDDTTGLTANNTDDSSTDLSWDNDSNDSHNVYQAESTGSSKADYTLVASGITNTSHTVTGLENGERFYFRVSGELEGNEGDLSNEVNVTTTVPAPALDDLNTTVENEITLSITPNDNSADGDIEVYRSTDGSLGSKIADGLGVNDTDYTDSTVLDGETYHYTIRRVTDHADADSSQLAGTTPLPAPSVSVVSSTTDEITVEVTDNADNEDGYRIFYKFDGGAFAQDGGDLAAVSGEGSTFQHTLTGLLNGENYTVKARVFTEEGVTDSPTASGTTGLPAPSDPRYIDTGTEDELTFAWDDTTNNGDYHVEYRETGASAWIDEATVGGATTSRTITGLEDGERYETRVRSETEHTLSAWAGPQAATTVLPAPTDADVPLKDESSVQVTYTDNSDNEDTFVLERADGTDPLQPDGYGPFSDVGSAGPDETSIIDIGLEPNRRYKYRVRVETEHTTSTSDPVTVRTDVRFSDGWHLVLDRPDMGRVDVADVNITAVDGAHPHTALADLSVDIPFSAKRAETLTTGTTTKELFFNGNRIFTGYLERSDSALRADRTTLEGRGIGRDLTDVENQYEFTDTATNDALEAVLSDAPISHTVISPDVDEQVTDESLTTASTQAELSSLFSSTIAPDDPVIVENGEVKMAQTSFLMEAEDTTTNWGGSSVFGDGFSEGEALQFQNLSDTLELEFTLDYEIPAGDVEVRLLKYNQNENHFGYNVLLDGQEVVSRDANTELTGETVDDMAWDFYTFPGFDDSLSPGDHTLTVEIDGNTSDGGFTVDAANVCDGRFSYFFDDSPSGSEIQGPENYPTSGVWVRPEQQESNFNVTGINAYLTMSSVSGDQRVEVSADRRQSWQGTSNSGQTTQDYPDNLGTTVDVRVRLDAVSNQTSGESPQNGNDTQRIQDIDIRIDGSDQQVIDNQKYTGDLLTIIQQICRRGNYRITIDHQADPVELTAYERGTQVKSQDWTILNRNPTVDVFRYANRVTVYGGVQDDGTRPKATVQLTDEIEDLGGDPVGVRPVTLIRPDVSTLDDARSVARTEASARAEERTSTGVVEIMPEAALPGYDYEIDWHDDGTPTESSSEKVTWSDEYGGARGRVQFDRDRGVTPEVIEAKYTQKNITDVV